MSWEVATTDVFDDWFTSLEPDAQAELIAKVELLKVFGPRLGRPHADTLKGSRYANLKERRASTRAQVLRVAFAFDPERAAILLIGGDKAGTSKGLFYRQLIAKAELLFEKHLRSLRPLDKDAH
jgi:hypothetical protein